MGILADLQREQLEREGSIHSSDEPIGTTAAVPAIPVLLPIEGQLYSDRINPGYGWVVSRVDDEFVWLNMLNPRGELTESYLQWARNRWATLVERHGLELVDA